jgi:hypothetical protein
MDDGLCSLDGSGWVSTDSWDMEGCDATWLHIFPNDQTVNCGGHDGDTVRLLALGDEDCSNYQVGN